MIRELFQTVKSKRGTMQRAVPISLWNNFQNILNSYFQLLKLQPARNAGWIGGDNEMYSTDQSVAVAEQYTNKWIEI